MNTLITYNKIHIMRHYLRMIHDLQVKLRHIIMFIIYAYYYFRNILASLVDKFRYLKHSLKTE